MSTECSVDDAISAIKHEYLAHAGKRPSRVVSMSVDCVLASTSPVVTVDRLVKEVFDCDIVHRSPPAPQYEAAVIKGLFSKLPEEDLTESLYGLYSKVLNCHPGADCDLGYCSYELMIPGVDSPVPWVCSIRQRGTVMSDIGRTVWDAGVALADVLCAASKLIEGCFCLELGAGTGFTSIVAAASGAQAVLATDRDEEIVANARANAEHNGLAECVPCMVLDWEDESDDVFDRIADKLGVNPAPSTPARLHYPPAAHVVSSLPHHFSRRSNPQLDVILAADVIYTPELARSFVHMLVRLLTHWPHLFSFVAVTERVPETVAVFQRALREAGITFNRLTPDEVVGRPRKRWARLDVENPDIIFIYEVELESAKRARAQLVKDALHAHKSQAV